MESWILQVSRKTHAKFQKGQNKTVGVDVPTKYQLIASEMMKITSWKKMKKNDDNVQIICTSSHWTKHL